MKLFRPGSIGRLSLQNRIIMPAMGTFFADKDGNISSRLVAYYRRRAEGKPGLIIIENCGIDAGAISQYEPRIDQESHVAGMTKLVEAIHAFGVPTALQLQHAGRQLSYKHTGYVPVAPSPIPCPLMREMPKELTLADIKRLKQKYREAASRAKRAGFDAIELHGAHGYLLNQFISPLANQRHDQYGGNLRNRARFPLEIVREIRDATGQSLPIIYRLTADEHLPGGISMEDAVSFAVLLEEAGVDAIHVSAGTYGSIEWVIPPSHMPQGCHAHLAALIKKAVKLPIISVGRINSPEIAEKILEDGCADFVSVGRGMIADPDFPKKAAAGSGDKIRRCIGCNECIEHIFRYEPIACSVNPEAGREETVAAQRRTTSASKRVLIVGGGPAGMSAAIAAREQGHRVCLFEQEPRLGGKLHVASIPKFKKDISSLLLSLSSEVAASGADIRMGAKATAENIMAERPDVVILATGAIPNIPPIKGLSQDRVVMAESLLTGKASAQGNVVVVGGSATGCEVAMLLAEQGHNVTVLEMLRLLAGVPYGVRRVMLQQIESLKIRILTNATVREIAGPDVVFSDKEGERSLRADAVVLAAGYRSSTALAEELALHRIHYIAIGDCSEPRKILHAMREGGQAGLTLCAP